MSKRKKLKPAETTPPLASAHTLSPELMRRTNAMLESGDTPYSNDPTDLDRKEREEIMETGEIPHTDRPHRMTKIGRDA